VRFAAAGGGAQFEFGFGREEMGAGVIGVEQVGHGAQSVVDRQVLRDVARGVPVDEREAESVAQGDGTDDDVARRGRIAGRAERQFHPRAPVERLAAPVDELLDVLRHRRRA
jgi:hypothetical protein